MIYGYYDLLRMTIIHRATSTALYPGPHASHIMMASIQRLPLLGWGDHGRAVRRLLPALCHL